jgi:hypothetical protein
MVSRLEDSAVNLDRGFHGLALKFGWLKATPPRSPVDLSLRLRSRLDPDHSPQLWQFAEELIHSAQHFCFVGTVDVVTRVMQTDHPR